MLINFDSIQHVALEFCDDENRYGADPWHFSGPSYHKILADLEGATVHIAWYGHGSYEGDSFVLYEKDGKLYENNASHCSCNGLEGKWEPEETTWGAISMRRFSDGYDRASEAHEIVQKLVAQHTQV